jgi:hypothetical protein
MSYPAAMALLDRLYPAASGVGLATAHLRTARVTGGASGAETVGDKPAAAHATLQLDTTFVRCADPARPRGVEIVVGAIESEGRSRRCFAAPVSLRVQGFAVARDAIAAAGCSQDTAITAWIDGAALKRHYAKELGAADIPISDWFLSSESQPEAPTFGKVPGVGSALRAGYRREANQQIGLLADRVEQLGVGVLRDRGRGDREVVESAPALCVNGAFGNALAVLMRQLLDQLIVLQQQRPARTDGDRVLVIGDRRAGAGRQPRSGLVIDVVFHVALHVLNSVDIGGRERAVAAGPSGAAAHRS